MQINSKVSIAPEQRHFLNIRDLKESIYQIRKTYLLPDEESEINQQLLSPKPNQFEAIKTNKNDKILIPTQLNYSYLYRGENGIFENCAPSLYRNHNLTIEYIFLERLRSCEFELLLKNHPVVNKIFIPNNIRVSYLGLAQHYGLKTDIIDFTSDLDIALFFATSIYNKINDCFEPNLTTGIHTSTLYLIPSIFMFDEFNGENFLDSKISAIGFQPFIRPGIQKGFCYRVEKDEKIHAIRYTFNYTASESEYYYKLFNNGKLIWNIDPLAIKTNLISKQKMFSKECFNLCFNRYRINGITSSTLIKRLKKHGVEISYKSKPTQYSHEEKQYLKNYWNEKHAKSFSESIMKRNYEELINTKQIKHNFLIINILAQIELLRAIKSGVPIFGSQLNKNEKEEKKQLHENKNLSKEEIKTRWKYTPETWIATFPKPFLTHSDCIIN